jgi:hypothetical protein
MDRKKEVKQQQIESGETGKQEKRCNQFSWATADLAANSTIKG